MRNPKNKAFTLLEVTLVIVMIVVLATLAFTKFVYVIERAKAVEAVTVLRKVKKLQNLQKEIHGKFVGNGDIANFPQLMFKAPPLEHFYGIEVRNDPFNVCTIYRSDGSYHLHIEEDGTIICTVDDGQENLCTKLGFQIDE